MVLRVGFGRCNLHSLNTKNLMAQYVYTMNKVSKTVPPKRQILKTFPFLFPGAKIGVLGQRSAVVAQDHGRHRQGNRRRACRCRSPSAIWSRSPAERGPHRAGIVERWAMYAPRHALKRFTRLRREDADFDARGRQAELEAIIATAGTDPNTSGNRRRRLRLPPWKPTSACCRAAKSAVSRCAACCCQARHAAARRTDQPPGRRIGRMARSFCSAPRHGGGHHPRPLLLDNAAEWILELDRGRGIPWKGNYSTWLEQKGSASRRNRRARKHAKALKKNSNGRARTPRRVGPNRRVWPASRTERFPKAQRNQGNLHPRGRRLGQCSNSERHKSFGDRC